MKFIGVLLAIMAIAFAVVSALSAIPQPAGCNGGPPPGPPPPFGFPPGPPPPFGFPPGPPPFGFVPLPAPSNSSSSTNSTG